MDQAMLEILRVGDAPAMLSLLFLALARGWLITRREADAYREDRDLWRDAYQAKDKKEGITQEQFNELLEGSRTSRTFIESFMKVVQE